MQAMLFAAQGEAGLREAKTSLYCSAEARLSA